MTEDSYYNTTHVRGQKLKVYEFAAERQEEAVLDYTPVGGYPAFAPYWPGASAADGKAHLVDSPNALFLAATLLTAMPATAIGQNVGFSTGAGGTTVGGGATEIVKTDETVEGAWGREIYLWKLAPDPRRPLQGELLPTPAFPILRRSSR